MHLLCGSTRDSRPTRIGPGPLRVLVLLAAFVLGGGCVEGKRAGIVRYDPAADVFAVTTVCWDICADQPAEIDHLAQLWEVRRRLLVSPFPTFLSSEPLLIPDFQLFPEKRIAAIDLARPAKGPPTPAPWPVDLAAVVVRPGDFFRSPQNTLCYVHRMDVPGRVLDELLALVRPQVNAALVVPLKHERQRRTAGGARVSWDAFRLDAAAFFAASEAERAAGELQDKNPFGRSWLPLFDDRSLTAVLAEASAGRLAPSRTKTRFQIGLPLAAEDARQFASTVEIFVACVLDEIEKNGHKLNDEAVDRSLVALLKSLAVRPEGRAERVLLSFDVGPYLTATEIKSKPDAAKKTLYETTVAGIRGRGIPLSAQTTLDEVVNAAKAPPPAAR